MKATNILLAATSLLLIACNNEDFTEVNAGNELVFMTFSAGVPQTRTSLAEDNGVHWTFGDRIALYDGNNKNEFTTNEVDGSNTTFTGKARTSDCYTAFYPYDNVVGIDHSNVTFTLPAEQTAMPGTFAPNLAPSWAQVKDGSNVLQFHNLCALVKFTVSADMAGEGCFTLVGGNATEKLAGTLTYNLANGTTVADPSAATRVTLSGNFEAGKAYYFVVAPGTLSSGFSLLYENSQKKLYRKATTQSVTLTAGKILNLGGPALPNFTPAISSDLYGYSETVNADGTITLDEDALKEVQERSGISIYEDKKDLAGIGHCIGVKSLDIYDSKLSSFELSWLPNLTSVRISENSALASVKVYGLPQLTFIEMTGNSALTTVECTDLPELDYFRCSYNPLLTSLKLDNLPKIDDLTCEYSALASLDVNNLTTLTRLVCNNNKLTSLDISKLSALQMFGCDWNELTSVDVSHLLSLESFGCNNNRLTSLDVSKNVALKGFACHNNRLSKLDIRNNKKLIELWCGNQTSNGTDEQTLILSLTEDQKQTTWDYYGNKDRPENKNVALLTEQ